MEEEGIERTVRSALESLGVDHEILPCDPNLADTAAFCEHYGVPPSSSANAILVASKKEPKQYAVCLALATTQLDVNHAVRELMGGKKLSFAAAEETEGLTGMMVGGVTPFGLPENLPIYIDSRVMGADFVVVGGGSRSCKIKVAPEALKRIPGARIIENLAREKTGGKGDA